MLPYYRDWYILPYYTHIDFTNINFGIIEKLLYNILFSLGFDRSFLVLFYIIFWVIISFYFNLKSFKNIVYKLTNEQYPTPKQALETKLKVSDPTSHSNGVLDNNKYTDKIFLVLITIFYILNYWTIERVLMGQVDIIKGHLIFVPLITSVIIKIFYTKYSLKNSFLSSFLLVILCAISIHYYVFGLISMIVVTIIRIYYLEGLELNKIIKKLLNFLLILCPSFIIFFNNLLFIAKEYNFGIGVDKNVIGAFSLSSRLDQNIYLTGLQGSGSWMTRTFVEIKAAQSELGIFRFLFSYWNDILGLFLITVFTIILLVFINQVLRLERSEKISYLKAFIICLFSSLILNFGLSKSIFYSYNNQIYNNFLLNIFREPGKFYSVSIFLISIILIFSYNNLKTTLLRLLSICCIVIMLFSNSILAYFILKNINLKNLEVLNQNLEQVCGDKKILFLPDDLYYKSQENKEIFASNIFYLLGNCNFMKARSTAIMTDNGVVYLYRDKFNQEIESIYYANNCDLSELKKNSITAVMIEPSLYAASPYFIDCLNKKSNTKYQVENYTLYLLKE